MDVYSQLSGTAGGYSWPAHPDQLEGHVEGINTITFIHTPNIPARNYTNTVLLALAN